MLFTRNNYWSTACDVKQAKGYVKGTTGKAFGNKSLENRGKIEPATDNAQKQGDGTDGIKKGR